MKLIRCQKCGTVVISEETFLQNIMDAMEDTCRKARRAKSRSERDALLQEAAEKHRAKYHQKISADDDHYDRDEKHKYRAQGLCYHNGGNICADEQNCADDAENLKLFVRRAKKRQRCAAMQRIKN